MEQTLIKKSVKTSSAPLCAVGKDQFSVEE